MVEMKLNTVICANCLDVMPSIADKSIDMVLCDLPYGTTACKWDVIIPFEPMWKQYKRVIKDNGAIVLTASQPFTSKLVMSNLKMFKYEWIWEKQKASNFMSAKFQPMKYHENILVFGKGTVKYIPQKYKISEDKRDKRKTINQPNYSKEIHYGKIKGSRKKDTGLRFPKSVIKINKMLNNIHPTQKPVALFEYLIKTYTNEGDTVLDNAAGSFTTTIACENLKRNWICIEKEEKYCEIGRKRIAENKEKLRQQVFDL